MLHIGLDVHKRQHEVVILDRVGKPRGKPFKIANRHEGVKTLLARIAAVNLLGEPLRFGLEATGHYWLALYTQLTHAGYDVIIINPIKTSAQRKLRIRPVKNDRIDARTIADLIRLDPTSDHFLAEPEYFGLRQLTRTRTELADRIAELKRRLQALLDQVFPEFETLFSPVCGRAALALLERYPTPADLLQADLDEVADLLGRHSSWRLGRTRAEEVLQAAQSSFGVPFCHSSYALQIRLLAEEIRYLQQHLRELAHEIERLVASIPQYLTTVAGIGPVLAGSILGEIGDYRRFKNAKALVAYAGLDPRVHQSGEFIGKRAHLSKRGSTYLRRALWIAAMAATRNDPGFKALLEQKLKQGKHYQVAMGAVANKLVHVLYAVLRDGRPYQVSAVSERALAA